MAVLKDLNVEWIPLRISYFFIRDDNDQSISHVPNSNTSEYPDYPKPRDMGFECQDLQPLTSSDSEPDQDQE